MSGLTKRVDALEKASETQKRVRAFLWVCHASDGGLVFDGRFYEDESAMLRALGAESDDAFIFGCKSEHTAAELLAAAEERKRNPPPEVTLDDLGGYGRKLVEEEGLSPAVAKLFEKLAVPTS